MSVAFADMHVILFKQFASDGSIVRGTDAPVAVPVIVDRNVEKLGDYGQVIGHVVQARFLTAQWVPKQGDVLTVEGETRKVDKLISDDGFVATAVLYG